MNDFLDRLLDLPLRQRVLLLVGGIVFLVGLYAFFIYWPRGEEIQFKTEQLASLEIERDRKAGLVANLAEARAQAVELKAALRKAVAQLPDTKEIPNLLSAISAVAGESGLEIAQFRQRPEIFKDFYAEVPVDILVRGTYFQVEAFFQRVSALTRIVNVSDIGMKAPSVIEGDVIRLQTSCSATTFRFLDEEERERIAKQREKGGKR